MEKCRGEVLWRSVVVKFCGWRSVVVKFCGEVFW